MRLEKTARAVTYYLDVQTKKTIVREVGCCWPEEISEWNLVWREVERDHPYERELYMGQGDNCLRKISRETAKAYLAAWGVDLDAE